MFYYENVFRSSNGDIQLYILKRDEARQYDLTK